MASLGLLLVLALQDPPPVRDWMEGLRAEHAEERTRAFNQLRLMGRGAEPWLKRGVRDADPELAERSRLLLRTLAIRETLPPRVLREFPGIENRLALEPGEWTALLIEAVRQHPSRQPHPALTWSDLDALAGPALQGAVGPNEILTVCEIIGGWRLTSGLPGLHALLRHPNADVRRRVINTLAVIRSASSVGPLAELLDDPELRGDVAWTLARYERQSAVAALARMVESPDLNVRHALIQCFENRARADDVPVLRRLLRDPEPRISLQAAQILSQLGEDAGDLFLPQLRSPHPHIRSQAQYQLGSRRPSSALPKIRALLQAPEPELRTSALWLLSSYGDTDSIDDVAGLLEDPVVSVRRAAISVYRQLYGGDAVPRLARLLSDPAEEIRLSALYSLALLGWTEILPDIAARIEDPDESIRVQMVDLLGRSELAGQSPLLARRLLDPSSRVQVRAIRTIGWQRYRDLAPALVPLLADPEENRAHQIETTLVGLNSRAAIPGLLQGLSQPDALMRQRCFSVLTQMQAPEATAAIPRLLDDPDATLRQSAIRAAGDVGMLAAIPKLRALLKDPDSDLRTLAMRSLCTLRATELTPEILPMLLDPSMQNEGLLWLHTLKSRESVPVCLKILENPEGPCAYNALNLIVGIEDQRAIPLLRRIILQENHPFRLHAVKCLEQLGATDAIPDLLPLLQDCSTFVQDMAAEALAGLGAREAIPALLRIDREDGTGERTTIFDALVRLDAVEIRPIVMARLGHENPSVVRAAVQAAERLDLRAAIPALRALARGDDLNLRSFAADALIRLGDASEAADAVGTTASQMFALNRIRKPEIWARLRSTPLPRFNEPPSVEVLEELACGAGLELRIETDLGNNRDRSFCVRGGAATMLEALDDMMSSNGIHVILEDRWIRVVDHHTAAALWQDWLRRERSR